MNRSRAIIGIADQPKSATKSVLNVGGGSNRNLPPEYDGWNQVVIDIDPQVSPDICLDAKLMDELPGFNYDAAFCSHNLEHFYKHDVPLVLKGMLHVLKDGGFAHISVPSFSGMIAAMQRDRLDINDVWYRTSGGTAITFHDVLYGWNHAMENGNLYYAHRCAFTQASLSEALLKAGFDGVHIGDDGYNIVAKAYKGKPCQ